MKKESLNIIYQEDGLLFGEADQKYYLILDQRTFRLSDHPYEPCLYIKESVKMMVTLHNSFTVDELIQAARTEGTIHTVTGNDYTIGGVFKLIRKAIELSMPSVDIGYVEGQCFMDYLKKRGAVSPETAVGLTDAGMQHSMLYPFIHSKKIGQTTDGLYYIKTQETTSRCSRVISDLVVFGYGYREVKGRRQYYAWHGYPSRNDDYITTAEISESEFRQIEAEYPEKIQADRDTAELFRKKYVNDHPVILEGWNKLL